MKKLIRNIKIRTKQLKVLTSFTKVYLMKIGMQREI